LPLTPTLNDEFSAAEKIKFEILITLDDDAETTIYPDTWTRFPTFS